VIRTIIGRDHSDQILASIGAGPFEDLMGSHGAQFIDRVEMCARTHPVFKRMLELYGRTRFLMMCGFEFRPSRRLLVALKRTRPPAAWVDNGNSSWRLCALSGKIVLHCPNGLHGGLEPLVHRFIRRRCPFVAVAGSDASLIEDIIDESARATALDHMRCLLHHPGESLAAVVEFAKSLSLEYAGPVEVVEF